MRKQSSIKFSARDYLHPRHWGIWCALGLLRLVSLLPYRPLMAVGRSFGSAIRLVAVSRRKIVDINLQHCFPDKSRAERDRIKHGCFQSIGISLVEMSMCWWWSDERLKPLVEIQGREHIDAAFDSGKGVILLAGHFTSLEISGRLFTFYSPVSAMYRTQTNEMFDSYLYTQRSKYIDTLISRKNMRQMIRSIRNKLPAWYAPDQDFPDEKNVFAPFMGVQTATIIASSRIAQATGCAMLPFYPERKQDGSGYIIRIDAPLTNFPSGDDLEDATKINHSIEHYARLHPENYMWVHRRFKTRPAGEPPFYS